MAFKLIKRNKARVTVEGAINDDNGAPVKFKYVLLCKRLNQEEIDIVLEDKKRPVSDFLHDVIDGWEDVADEDGNRIEFSASNLDDVLLQPGMRQVCFLAYLKEVGATAKN